MKLELFCQVFQKCKLCPFFLFFFFVTIFLRNQFEKTYIKKNKKQKKTGDNSENAEVPPLIYWNAAGAMYAYLFQNLVSLNIDVLGEVMCFFTLTNKKHTQTYTHTQYITKQQRLK